MSTPRDGQYSKKRAGPGWEILEWIDPKERWGARRAGYWIEIARTNDEFKANDIVRDRNRALGEDEP